MATEHGEEDSASDVCTGARRVVEALERRAVQRAFGVPGVHSLPIFDALRESRISVIPGRTEMASAFSADGHARATGEPTALLLSTGPGTLMSLGGVLESALSHVPVVVLSSQVRLTDLGRRRGALHEAPDQLASLRPIVKWAKRAVAYCQLAPLVEEAVLVAGHPPTGPVYLELPTDLLSAEASWSRRDSVDVSPPARLSDVSEAVELLDRAERPVLWAGGGVVRSGAFQSLLSLAERIDAPVAMTYMGKGAIDARHPLAAGSACEEDALLGLIRDADAVLAIGTELGAETTAQWDLDISGDLIQVDASADRLGTVYSALPVIGDADVVLTSIANGVRPRERRSGALRAHQTRDAIKLSLEQGDRNALSLLEIIRDAVPWSATTAWDMTILGYWAASIFPVAAGRTWLYPLGSGTIGYAMSAGIGACAAGERTLAITGDGGAMYSLSELAVVAQHSLPLTWLIVDDGGYGVLRHYQHLDGKEEFAVDLVRPDFVALAQSVGIRAARTEVAGLSEALRETFNKPGPSVLVIETRLAPPPGLV